MRDLAARIVLCILASVTASACAAAQDPDRTYGFASASITLADGPLAGREFRYRILVPDDLEEDETVPLLLFLHGAGERGADNVEQLRHLPEKWSRADFRARYRAVVVAPQCPRGETWIPVDWSRTEPAPPDTPAPYLDLVDAILAEVLASRPVDPDRVLLTGLSMGGFGSWALAARDPERFAGVVPVCGGGDPATAARLATLPIWAWHGARDHVVPPIWSQRMVDAVRAAGGPCHYTELPGTAHGAWGPAYGPSGALDWLFARRRGEGYLGLVMACDQAGSRLLLLDTGIDWADAEAVHWSCGLTDLQGLPEGAAEWFENPTDAKPLGRGTSVLVTASGGGVAIVRIADRKPTFVARVEGDPQSAARLPDGSLVVASSSPGRLSRLIPQRRADPVQPPAWTAELPGARGVHADAATGEVFALGEDELVVFRLLEGELTLDRRQRIPTGPGPEPRGGLDLWSAMPGSLLVTDRHHGWTVTAAELKFAPFPASHRFDGARSLVPLRPGGPWLATLASEWDGGIVLRAGGDSNRWTRPGARFCRLRPWP